MAELNAELRAEPRGKLVSRLKGIALGELGAGVPVEPEAEVDTDILVSLGAELGVELAKAPTDVALGGLAVAPVKPGAKLDAKPVAELKAELRAELGRAVKGKLVYELRGTALGGLAGAVPVKLEAEVDTEVDTEAVVALRAELGVEFAEEPTDVALEELAAGPAEPKARLGDELVAEL